MINVNDTCFPCTAAARDSACAPVQGRTRGVACERRRVAGALPSTNITVTPIQQYRLHQPLLLLRHQSQQPLELSGNVGLTNHASLRRRTQPPPHRPSQTNHEPPRHPPAPSRKRRRNPTPPKVGPAHKWPTRPTTWAHTQHLYNIYIYMVLRISANTLVQALAHLLAAARSREHGGKRQDARSARGAAESVSRWCRGRVLLRIGCALRCAQVGHSAVRRARRVEGNRRRPAVPTERAAARRMRQRKGRRCRGEARREARSEPEG